MGNHSIECDYCYEDTRGLCGVRGCYSKAQAKICYNYKEMLKRVKHPEKAPVEQGGGGDY